MRYLSDMFWRHSWDVCIIVLNQWFSISCIVCQSVSWLTSIQKLWHYRDNFSSRWDMLLKSFWDITGIFLEYFLQNFMYVCQSVSWLTSILKLYKYWDISCSGWDIFLNLFRDIPEMFIHYFQIIINFVYVCQSLSWLTSILKLDKYRDISCSWWYIFLKFFGDFFGMFVHFFQIITNFLYVC